MADSAVVSTATAYVSGQSYTFTTMKGIFNDRPPGPRYTATWDIQTVLETIKSFGGGGQHYNDHEEALV